MNLDVEVVHRIVAWAFLGNPPSSQHVVDILIQIGETIDPKIYGGSQN